MAVFLVCKILINHTSNSTQPECDQNQFARTEEKQLQMMRMQKSPKCFQGSRLKAFLLCSRTASLISAISLESQEHHKHKGIVHLLTIYKNKNIYFALNVHFEMARSRGMTVTCLPHRQPASSLHCHLRTALPQSCGSSRGNINVFPQGTAALSLSNALNKIPRKPISFKCITFSWVFCISMLPQTAFLTMTQPCITSALCYVLSWIIHN